MDGVGKSSLHVFSFVVTLTNIFEIAIKNPIFPVLNKNMTQF